MANFKQCLLSKQCCNYLPPQLVSLISTVVGVSGLINFMYVVDYFSLVQSEVYLPLLYTFHVDGMKKTWKGQEQCSLGPLRSVWTGRKVPENVNVGREQGVGLFCVMKTHPLFGWTRQVCDQSWLKIDMKIIWICWLPPYECLCLCAVAIPLFQVLPLEMFLVFFKPQLSHSTIYILITSQ